MKPLGMGLPGKKEWFEETERVWLTWNVKILGFDSATGLPHLIHRTVLSVRRELRRAGMEE